MSQGATSLVSSAATRSWVRSKDRRTAFSSLLASLSRSLRQHHDPEVLRKVFEHGVRHLLPLRWAELRDSSLNLPVRAGSDVLSVNVPSGDPGRSVTLDGEVEPGRRLGDWDQQVLANLVHVAALVAQIEHLARARVGPSTNGSRGDGAAPLIGSSAVMCRLRERIEKVAATDFTVLVEGESGTGKELVARHVHDLSRRCAGPFVAINCAALVETLFEAELFGIEDRTATGVRGRRGKFEHADAGTLFLDEVSDLSVSAQAKLLRAIQDLAVEPVGACGARRIDTRIVVATNRSLSTLVEHKLFRQDLFYRLSGVEIMVPPLRSRREDILELARYFLARHRAVRRLEFSPQAADALQLYDWPGNVRELERVVEGVVALAHGDRIDLDDLPPAIRGDYVDILMPSLTRGESLRAWASRYVRLVLERCNQNKRQACRRLGISYHTLRSHLRYQSARTSDDRHEVVEWPDAPASDLATCRVAETADDELSRSTAARQRAAGICKTVEPMKGAITTTPARQAPTRVGN